MFGGYSQAPPPPNETLESFQNYSSYGHEGTLARYKEPRVCIYNFCTTDYACMCLAW